MRTFNLRRKAWARSGPAGTLLAVATLALVAAAAAPARALDVRWLGVAGFTLTSGATTIEAASTLRLRAPQIALEASGALDIKASGTLTLRGAMILIN